MSESILEEAQRLIHGPRNKNYGHPRDNFADIAALWSGYLNKEVSDIDVANLMILMKVARVKGTGYHRDSFTDIAGYAGCVERIYEEPEETPAETWAKIQREAGEEVGKAFDRALIFNEVGGQQKPRGWRSIGEVPIGVEVMPKDRQGLYLWTEEDGAALLYRDSSDQPWSHQYWDESYDVYLSESYGPFTEVLEAE